MQNYNKFFNRNEQKNEQRNESKKEIREVSAQEFVDEKVTGLTSEKETPIPQKETKKAIVKQGTKLNLRCNPNKASNILRVLNPGESVTIIVEHPYTEEDSNGGWAHVVTDSGVEGYVMEEFIKVV